MTWEVLIPIIANQGLALAEKLWQLYTKGAAPTQEDWNILKELAKLRAINLMQQSLLRAGIDPESAEGKELLLAATTGI